MAHIAGSRELLGRLGHAPLSGGRSLARLTRRVGRSPRTGPWWLWACVGIALAVSLAAWGTAQPSTGVPSPAAGAGVPVTAVPATTPPAAASSVRDVPGNARSLGPWRLQSRALVLATLADEGLATVQPPGHPTSIVFRGSQSVGPGLRDQGWVHVGDPGGWHGYLFDAYQGPPQATAKMFQVTAPDGSVHRYVHDLTAGEQLNNSFAAVSPDGQWLVSGEWGRMTRLLVFPTPLVNRRVNVEQTWLPLAATISLDRPVRDVQGCAFVSGVRLLCASDDAGRDLWPTPYQLLQVTLPHPLTGRPTSAHVTSLGELPMASVCRGAYEVEGIDYGTGTGTLRVEVTPPGRCGLSVAVYAYRQARSS